MINVHFPAAGFCLFLFFAPPPPPPRKICSQAALCRTGWNCFGVLKVFFALLEVTNSWLYATYLLWDRFHRI